MSQVVLLPNKYCLLSLAIPFYNEEENVEPCIRERVQAFKKAGIDFEIIGVDNGSWDKTSEILERLKGPNVKVVHVKKNRGFGYGIKQGWLVAKGNYIGYDGGDRQTDAASLARIFKKLVDEDLDLCKGYRKNRGYNLYRRFESKVYNILAYIILGYSLGDINGYPKIMTRRCYNIVNPNDEDEFFDGELLMRAIHAKMRIGRVDLHFRERPAGKSKLHFLIGLTILKTMIEFRLKMLLGKVDWRKP